MIAIACLWVIALMMSWLLSGAIRRYALANKIIDIPIERSSHNSPIPRGGGLAIVIVTLAGVVIYWLIYPNLLWKIFVVYIIGAVPISAVSWLDDLRSLPKRLRFVAHSVSAIFAICGFGYFQIVSIPILGQLDLGWIGLPITFLWIVGLINAYNFMDGIDGIAGGQAVIAGLGWVWLGWFSGQPFVSILGVLITASSLGFLGHNWPPARIFMGDVGSAFLGYTFAVFPIMAGQNDSRLVLAGVLLVWPFIFDTVFTFLRRLRKGEDVFVAHRSHLYQRLVIAGYSHRFVSSLYMGLALIGATLALTWFFKLPACALAIIFIIPSLCLALWVFVIRQEYRCNTRPQARLPKLRS